MEIPKGVSVSETDGSLKRRQDFKIVFATTKRFWLGCWLYICKKFSGTL